MKQNIVMYSGGVGSYEAARRAVIKYGVNSVKLLFADTLMEDPDLYIFLDQTSALLNLRVIRLVDGRNPWQLFRELKLVGTSQRDMCSRILKREICDRWLDDNCDPNNTRIILGLESNEEQRIVGASRRFAENGWETYFPLNVSPIFNKHKTLLKLSKQNVKIPRLYTKGFSHNNCGGFCIKAGHGHFLRLLKELPDVFARHEIEEEITMKYIGPKSQSVLKDRKNGITKSLTLKNFRKSAEQQHNLTRDFQDVGNQGCGCFSPVEDN